MGKKENYKLQNEAFLAAKAAEPGVQTLPKGVLYEVMKSGDGKMPTIRSIVSVYYKGMLINGKVFDDNTHQGYPDAMRLKELITGWQIVLPRMKVGDQWRIYLPADTAYGSRSVGNIPGNSTLIFEIELRNVM